MSIISRDRWHILSPYLDQALTLPPEDRLRWLESLRAEDPTLAVDLGALLEEHRVVEQKRYLETLPGNLGANDSMTGRTIGSYRLLTLIGQGGMGTVWLAERSDGRFDRKAAVKFLSTSLTGHSAEERFKREGAILGRFSHPNIAQLLDAGVSADGHLYIILEYVEGEPIDQYCDRHKLDIPARVALFRDVLSAVAHAHANLIIHRDIKPSNVLVSKDGKVKLLDFGIAKLLEKEGQEASATLLTQEAGAALTPAFAAPEQVSGEPVTTATDVYALGVLLYILLSGQHPAGDRPQSPAEMVRAIVDKEPPRLSQVVALHPETKAITTRAEQRSSTPEKLRRTLRGDLEIVVAKALEKNPQERYSSVTAFAADLEKYLRHEPIGVQPAAITYRLRKYVRRHRLGVALAATFMTLLVGFAAMQTVQLRRITRERDRADRIADFMTGIFKVSNPGEKLGNAVTAREILDKASKDIDTGLSKDPELQSRMMYEMGMAYLNLGVYSRAQALLEGSIRAANASIGPENLRTLKIMQRLAWTLYREGKLNEADAQFRRLLETERRVLGPQNPETVGVMGDMATILDSEGRFAEAETLQREVLEAQKRLIGPEAHYTLMSANNLANMLVDEGRAAEAEKLEEETLQTQRRVYGDENLTTIEFTLSYAEMKAALGADEEAQKILRDLLEVERRILGPHQPETGATLYDLATLAAKHGRQDEAISFLAQAVDVGLLPQVASGMDKDPALTSLHGDARFPALVALAKEPAQKQN